MKATIGQRIRELREAKNLKQMQLSKKLGIAQTTLSSWERGRSEPHVEAIIGLAKFFKVPLEYLMGVTDDYF